MRKRTLVLAVVLQAAVVGAYSWAAAPAGSAPAGAVVLADTKGTPTSGRTRCSNR